MPVEQAPRRSIGSGLLNRVLSSTRGFGPVVAPLDDHPELFGGFGHQQAQAHRGREKRATGRRRLRDRVIVSCVRVAPFKVEFVLCRVVALLGRIGFEGDEKPGQIPA